MACRSTMQKIGSVLVLKLHPILERAEVVADVQSAGGLDTGQNTWFHAELSRGSSPSYGMGPVAGKAGRAKQMEVQIEKWVYGGAGLARHEGRVVMVPYVMPGERIEVESIREKPGMIEGRGVQRLEDSSERIAAGCPVFEKCGGCHYQQATAEFQAATEGGDPARGLPPGGQGRGAGGDRSAHGRTVGIPQPVAVSSGRRIEHWVHGMGVERPGAD